MYADLIASCRQYMLRPERPLTAERDVQIPVRWGDGPSIAGVINWHHAAWSAANEGACDT